MRHLIIIATLLTVAAALAACGDGEEDRDSRASVAPGPAVAAPEGAEYAEPVLADHDTDAQTPRRGKLVAQNGFDRRRDGFSFENYGPTLGGPQMRPQEIREIFGDAVCAGPAEEGCTLTPEAENWRLFMNANSVGGHCYGFSVLSEALRRGSVDRAQYGATSSTFDLQISTPRGLILNPELHADLSRTAVLQHVPAVREKNRYMSPNEALAELRTGLNAGGGYVIGMFLPDPTKTVGHAVTPIGIEDMGNGQFDVLLYDNNFPHRAEDPESADRRMRIDTNRNRWEYQASTTPGAEESLYYGEGTTNQMFLVREEDTRLPLPCPFCEGTQARTVVGLAGDQEVHGRLRITDADGRVTGWDGDRYVNDIPGADVERPVLSKVWLAAPEPRYSLPGGGRYTVELVDVPENAPEQSVHVTGPGVGVALTGLAAAAEGSKLLLGPKGAVGLRPSGDDAIAGQLRVSTQGDRELRIDPSGADLQLRRSGGDVVLRGTADRVDVVDAADGEAATARPRTGRIDLDRLVGRAG